MRTGHLWKRLIYPLPSQSRAIHQLGTSQANEHVVPGGEHHYTTLDSPHNNVLVDFRTLDSVLNEHW